MIWTTAHYIQKSCCKNQFDKLSNSFPVAKYQRICEKQIDKDKLLNAQYGAFLTVFNFNIMSEKEYHEWILDYTYTIGKLIQPQVSKLVRKQLKCAKLTIL